MAAYVGKRNFSGFWQIAFSCCAGKCLVVLKGLPGRVQG